jgi:hypothetical protein
MGTDEGKVTSLVDYRLRARAAEEQATFAHLDRLYAAHIIVADAIARMRREIPALTPDEITRTFQTAAEELRGSRAATPAIPETALRPVDFWD